MVKVVCMVKLLKQPVSQYVSFLSMFVLGRHGSRLVSVRIFDSMIANSVPTQHFDVSDSLFTLIFTHNSYNHPFHLSSEFVFIHCARRCYPREQGAQWVSDSRWH